MVRDSSSSYFRDTTYLMVDNGIISDSGYAFTELTGYSKVDVFQKDLLVVLNKLLRIDCTVQDIENSKAKTPLFLFTKSYEAIEVEISINQLEDTDEKLYIFTERYNFRLKDKLNFVEQLLKDNVMGCAVFSATDLILLKANQTYLDFISTLASAAVKPLISLVFS